MVLFDISLFWAISVHCDATSASRAPTHKGSLLVLISISMLEPVWRSVNENEFWDQAYRKDPVKGP